MKHTSIEWLYDTIDNALIDYLEYNTNLNELSVAMLKAKQQAKEKYAQEIINAYDEGVFDGSQLKQKE